MENKLKSHKIFFSFLIIIFSLSIVIKTFQNDTFFNITIGKYILQNGIDMKEHFSWIEGLNYTYSHWAFDVLIYLIFNKFNFVGIYLFVILFTIIINLTLFNLLYKKNESNLISFIVTIFTAISIAPAFAARSQIISFLCFLIEIYCIEKFIETNKFKYAFLITCISIIVANFHAASWPLTLILFIPYIVSAIFNYILKNNRFNKVTFSQNYNFKMLLILFIIICLTGIITPIKDVPYTYIIKSLFGESNLLNNLSAVDYIQEMQPLVPIKNLPIMLFTVMLFLMLLLPTKLKLEHLFLIVGLYIMALSSGRFVFLLILLGSYVISDLMIQSSRIILKNGINDFELRWIDSFTMVIITIMFIIGSSHALLNEINKPYIDSTVYPVKATEFIIKNIDYKNMKIYNQYDNGSFLMLCGLKPFIDSRLDVYCNEFQNTDIYKDYIETEHGLVNYKDTFNKYEFTHLLIKNNSIINNYIKNDFNYNIIYSDDYFSIYEPKK